MRLHRLSMTDLKPERGNLSYVLRSKIEIKVFRACDNIMHAYLVSQLVTSEFDPHWIKAPYH